MKSRIGYNFWILSLTVVLLLLVLAAQFFTIRNLRSLQAGNQEAAVTFTINNRLQEIVNTAAVLEADVTSDNAGKKNIQAITDSLAAMGYNASVFASLNVDTVTRNNFTKLNTFIGKQVAVSFKIIEATEAANKALAKRYADSLINLKCGDSIYQTAINIEKGLEARLKNTFSKSTEASQKLSTLNKIFALIAIAAILILATIIVNRHRRQVSLIKALEKANDEVKKSALIKDQFLANMSHEIRTPLNAIKGFSSLLQQTSLNNEQQKFSDIIENSSNNLLNLVNDILDIAKIEAGKMTIEQREFDLVRMLQTLEAMFMNTAKEKQLDFSWQIDTNVPQYLQGDPDRIYQILVNLVSNAFKFTNKGFVKLAVANASENEKEITLQFKVQDTGIGIPLKKQDIIFERFQQAENTQENMQKGTGLGLAIVKNIAALLGGSIALSSTEGEGSVFTVLLPFAKNVSETNPVINAVIIDNTAITFSGANVLVAEDNKVNQLLITKLLEQYGIQPMIKENGNDVLEILKINKFDLLLLDIQMPGLDGYKTCTAIRESGNLLPVVAMTAYVMDAEKAKCKAAGMNDYLAKPLDENELKNILLKYLAAFAKPYNKKPADTETNSFLLQLAGGDKQMAAVILNQVLAEIPAEVKKLQKIIDEKNISALPAACHYLIGTISPLGNDCNAMQQIVVLQTMVAKKESEPAILKNTALLIDELESTFKNLKQQ